MQLKVCGMRDKENLLQVAALGVEYLGFIFYSASTRYVGDDFDQSFLSNIPTKKVGVFVDPELEALLTAIDLYQLFAVQLHGNETLEFIENLKQRSECQIWKAISIDSEQDLELCAQYQDHVDQFLFDTKSEAYGGSGLVFDWKILQGYKLSTPFMVAGGLGVDNIKQVLSEVAEHPQFIGVDINSKVELAPALKSVDQVRQVVEQMQ